ncbi:hypothetical protein Bbelb_147790 [Branchiostoma belcheri]|nr:hypothetical protein Bbelb_147790 [Branchiostoma belcheri]
MNLDDLVLAGRTRKPPATPCLDVQTCLDSRLDVVRRDSASGYIRPDEQAKLTLVEGFVYVLQRQTIGEEAAAANANPTGFTCTTGCTCTWYVEAAKGCGPSIETGHSGSVWSESAIASTPQDDSYYST